jgi:hypothetical protein
LGIGHWALVLSEVEVLGIGHWALVLSEVEVLGIGHWVESLLIPHAPFPMPHSLFLWDGVFHLQSLLPFTDFKLVAKITFH